MEPGTVPEIPGFRCLRRLALGRHGAVWQGERLADALPVALKVVPRERVADAARFLREAQILAGIAHPHIIACHGSGDCPAGLWLAMDLAGGGDVAALLQRGPPPAQRSLEIVRDAAAGLAELARRQLVHRDLSPANLLLMADGRCVLGDFGLVLADQQRLTGAGEIIGTPAYLAPEQARGETADPRSDIYALGACLFALATGRAPFRGDSAWAVLQQAANAPFPDPRAIDAAVPPGIRAMILAATAALPAERYADADDLRADAVALLAGGVPRHAGALRSRRLGPVESPARPPPGRGRMLAAGLAGLALGLAAGWLALRPDAAERRDFAAAGAAGTSAAWQAYRGRHPAGEGAATAAAALRLLAKAPPPADPQARLRLEQQAAALAGEIDSLRAADR